MRNVMNNSLETAALNSPLTSRKAYQWALGTLMILILAVGWKYPLLGFAVPITMIATMAGAASKGRFVCGNLCPRGTFLDTFFQLIGGKRPIPRLLFNPVLRWTIMFVLMGFMTYQIAQNPSAPSHWGVVFWTMCCATTVVAIVIGIAYRPRAWCAVCPAGTMANAIGGNKHQLRIASSCTDCGTCKSSCPMGFPVSEHRVVGVFTHRDCLKCSTCASNCSTQSLSFPS